MFYLFFQIDAYKKTCVTCNDFFFYLELCMTEILSKMFLIDLYMYIYTHTYTHTHPSKAEWINIIGEGNLGPFSISYLE